MFPLSALYVKRQKCNCVVIIHNFPSQNCNSCFVVFYYFLLKSDFFRPEDLCIFMCHFLLEAGCQREFSLHFNALPGWDEFCLTWSKAFNLASLFPGSNCLLFLNLRFSFPLPSLLSPSLRPSPLPFFLFLQSEDDNISPDCCKDFMETLHAEDLANKYYPAQVKEIVVIFIIGQILLQQNTLWLEKWMTI